MELGRFTTLGEAESFSDNYNGYCEVIEVEE